MSNRLSDRVLATHSPHRDDQQIQADADVIASSPYRNFPRNPFPPLHEDPYTLLPLISLSPNAANTDYSIVYLGTPTTYQYTHFPARASLQNEALVLNNYPWMEI